MNKILLLNEVGLFLAWHTEYSIVETEALSRREDSFLSQSDC